MARAAVGWGVRELAERAGITANTVTRIENGADAKNSTLEAIQRALEAGGVEFTNGDQPGVRLAKNLVASAGASSPSKRDVAGKTTRHKNDRMVTKRRKG
jgi:transcriptional regulator with XRE-family HTH domain